MDYPTRPERLEDPADNPATRKPQWQVIADRASITSEPMMSDAELTHAINNTCRWVTNVWLNHVDDESELYRLLKSHLDVLLNVQAMRAQYSVASILTDPNATQADKRA